MPGAKVPSQPTMLSEHKAKAHRALPPSSFDWAQQQRADYQSQPAAMARPLSRCLQSIPCPAKSGKCRHWNGARDDSVTMSDDNLTNGEIAGDVAAGQHGRTNALHSLARPHTHTHTYRHTRSRDRFRHCFVRCKANSALSLERQLQSGWYCGWCPQWTPLRNHQRPGSRHPAFTIALEPSPPRPVPTLRVPQVVCQSLLLPLSHIVDSFQVFPFIMVSQVPLWPPLCRCNMRGKGLGVSLCVGPARARHSLHAYW